MKQDDIIFGIALLGFFGISGATLLNLISNLQATYGNIIWVFAIGIIYLIFKEK